MQRSKNSLIVAGSHKLQIPFFMVLISVLSVAQVAKRCEVSPVMLAKSSSDFSFMFFIQLLQHAYLHPEAEWKDILDNIASGDVFVFVSWSELRVNFPGDSCNQPTCCVWFSVLCFRSAWTRLISDETELADAL